MTFDPTKYPLTYVVEHHPKPLTAEEVHARKGRGATHALFFASIMFPPDGSYSILFDSVDGRTEGGADLDDNEWFKVWAMLSTRLGKSKTLSPNKKALCADVHLAIQAAVFGKGEPH